ncbi:MAG: DNA polymerase/3'-5' exonuclease PolX [Planctomycetota bacterium]
MDNREVAMQFELLADLLEFKGENAFKIRSYRQAARLIEDLGEDITEIAAAGGLRDLPGVGEGIAKKIVEYIETGRMTRLEEARSGVPDGILGVLEIQGIGPKKAAMLYKEIGVDSVGALEKAAEEQRVRGLPGMGAKSEENILRGIRLRQAGAERMLLDAALDAADAVVEHLKSKRGLVSRITPAGSLRRRCESVGDIDILACGKDAAKILDAFVGGPYVADVFAAGETKASVTTTDGPQVDLRVVEPKQFGAALQYFTGSKAHNIKLRHIAKQKKMKINEYGLFRGKKLVASAEEEDIYRALGMEPMPPELREDRGEIEAAIDGTLPKLVEPGDIKGDFHVHSNYSDGRQSIVEIAAAAKALGYRFVAITDHSQSLQIAHGLTPERVRKQMKEIAAVNRKLRGFKVLAGIEVDIKGDGSLDLPDKLLADLDLVIASIHSGFKQPREKIMSRITAAMENPHVDIIGHPTGRLIGEREAYDVDVSELIRAAAATGIALEINAHPQRLDLNDVYCRMAKERGVKLAIGTDAHNAADLDMMQFGVSVARRGWLSPKDVLNTNASAKLHTKKA